MPRPTKLSPELEEELVAMYLDRDLPTSINDLVQYCATQTIVVSRRTICTMLAKYEARHHHTRVDTPELRIRIAALFFQESLPDDLILEVLTAEGWQLSFTWFVQLRKRIGIRRRISWQEAEERHEEFRSIIMAELDRGEINNYGRTMLYAHFRSSDSLQLMISRYVQKPLNSDKYLFYQRDRLFSIVRELDPVGVYKRSQEVSRRRGEYITPGPDFVWSLDAHCKLEPYGIQIYAAIDAYSRHIIWVYIGVSARTMISVFRQFASALKIRKVAPQLVRADKGKETLMAADAQYQHARRTRGEDCTFRGTFVYGTSVLNQRIESWWAQISRGKLIDWMVCLYSFYM